VNCFKANQTIDRNTPVLISRVISLTFLRLFIYCAYYYSTKQSEILYAFLYIVRYKIILYSRVTFPSQIGSR